MLGTYCAAKEREAHIIFLPCAIEIISNTFKFCASPQKSPALARLVLLKLLK